MGDTAFSHRDSLANMLAIVGWPHGSDPSEHIDWIRRFWTGLEPHTQGFYVNDLGPDETSTQINANYGENFNRLVSIKNRYDPGNLFRLNANVKPSV